MEEAAGTDIDAVLRPARDFGWALFLDFDGTLIDIAPRPDQVEVPDGLDALLAGLGKALDGALALISGRPVADLDRLLARREWALAGEHGAVLRLPWGEIERAPGVPLPPPSWRAALAALARENPGVLVEQKASGIAVHYRQAPQCERLARETVARLVAEQPGRFAVLNGHKVTEIRPRAIDKGWAVERLMRDPPFYARVPVFIGDDTTDEDGFRAARSLGGYGLNVHRYFPAGAAEVREWLEDRLGILQAG